jgi:hypothetical protein
MASIFFIDLSLLKINYQELCDKCEELIKIKLPNLQESPEDIPKSIKIKLPKAIPITSFEFTGEIAQSLRAFYNFDLLPSLISSKDQTYQNIHQILPQNSNTYFPYLKEANSKTLKI